MSTETPASDSTTNVALWGTQGEGGGLARWDAEKRVYVWVKLPDWYVKFPEITEQVGDPIPAEWGVIPANQLAFQQMLRENG